MRHQGIGHAGAERISAPILIPLVVAIALLMASVTWGVSWLVVRENQSRMNLTMRQTEALFRQQLQQSAEALDVGLHGVVGDPAYARPLRDHDRARLSQLVTPQFQYFHDTHDVTHFYVIDSGRVVVLRAHEPPLFGDRIDRLTMLQAQRTGTGAWGLELGPLGTLTLRSVMPYRADGQVLGYMELGVEIGHIVDRVHAILGVDLLVLIDKRRLDEKGWDEGRRLFHWPLAWDRLPLVAMANGTMTDLPEPLLRRLATAPADGAVATGDLSVGRRTLHIGSLPLLDAGGARVGSLVVVADQTALVAKSRLLMGGAALLCLGLGTVLVVLFRRIVGRVERRVTTAIDSLARSNADLERLAYVACHDMQQAVECLTESTETLGARHRSSLSGDGPEMLGAVLTGTYRVREIVETLEDYLDLDINARREPVALDAVVAAAMETLGPAFADGGVNAESLPVLSARPVPLARAVRRLMEAALECPVAGTPRRLCIAAAEGDGYWRIAFSDNGAGDTAARRTAIAEARMVAELHGGELLYATIPEGGRTVTLVLPTAAPPPRPADGE